jgi:hypothetical protein
MVAGRSPAVLVGPGAQIADTVLDHRPDPQLSGQPILYDLRADLQLGGELRGAPWRLTIVRNSAAVMRPSGRPAATSRGSQSNSSGRRPWRGSGKRGMLLGERIYRNPRAR